MKSLENLKWSPLWTSHIGCLKGCLDYLKMNISEAWLYGATGHAFILNIHEIVCPSGPTAWQGDILFKLSKNIGFTVEGIDGWKGEDNFNEKQRAAWDNTRKAIDDGLPCYGWEFDVPEFYVVFGYDDQGYYYSGPGADDGKGPFPWDKLGISEIGVLAMYRVSPKDGADDRTTVRNALSFAVKFAEDPGNWVYEKYKSGKMGYDLWIQALENNQAHDFGMAYNSIVWSECRYFAVKFLIEAKERLDNKLQGLFDEAIDNYGRVEKSLHNVSALFPFPPHDELQNDDRRSSAVENLIEARQYELKAIKTLKRIVENIGDD